MPLLEKLKKLNRKGILTINSQPRVNGAPSDDAAFGWGGRGGVVCQKAYLEFFCSPDVLQKLVTIAPQFPSITFQAVSSKGQSQHNIKTQPGVTPVTWRVWPRRETVQPTLADPSSSLAWKVPVTALARAPSRERP